MRHLFHFRILITLCVAGALHASELALSEQFYNAIRSDNQTAVAKLLTGGADVNTRDSRGNTPLMYASAIGSEDMIRKLLAAGPLAGAGRPRHAAGSETKAQCASHTKRCETVPT